MTIAIIVGILALAIAPLFWAMPSRRERQLAALRTMARKDGFSLQLTEIDHPDPSAEMQVSAGGKQRRPMQACVAYRLQRPPTSTETQSATHAERSGRSNAAVRNDAGGEAAARDGSLREDAGWDNAGWDNAGGADVQAMARSRLVRRVGVHVDLLPVGWQLAAGFEPADPWMCALAAQVGDDVLALESTQNSAAVFWVERGGEARLAELASMLRELMHQQSVQLRA